MFSLPIFTVDLSVIMSFNYNPGYPESAKLCESSYENKAIDAKTAVELLNEGQHIDRINSLIIVKHGFFASKTIYSHNDPSNKLGRTEAANKIRSEATAAYGPILRLFQEKI